MLSRPLGLLTQFWLREISPYPYALLRVAYGLLGLLTLAALWDVSYWQPDLLVASKLEHKLLFGITPPNLGAVIFWGSCAAFTAMTIGWHTNTSIGLAYASTLAHAAWNPLPLSAAFAAHRVVLFCLIWADCGAVYSIDARRAGKRPDPPQPFWPLRLIRLQVCLIYFWSGATKLFNAAWQEGVALHYVLSNAQFQRAPMISAILEPVVTPLSYVTLTWELLFPLAMVVRRVRGPWLWFGVALHIGMWLLLELGPFTVVMLASYLAFVEPDWLHRRLAKRTATLG